MEGYTSPPEKLGLDKGKTDNFMIYFNSFISLIDIE